MSDRRTTVAEEDWFLDARRSRCPQRQLVRSSSANKNDMRSSELDLLTWSLIVVLFLLFSSARIAHAQTQFDFTPEIDRLMRSGLNKMYSYDLKEADESFDELVRRFPEHPIGYMHKAEVVWWHALRDN